MFLHQWIEAITVLHVVLAVATGSVLALGATVSSLAAPLFCSGFFCGG